jgi:alpha-L-rhamnosidase
VQPGVKKVSKKQNLPVGGFNNKATNSNCIIMKPVKLLTGLFFASTLVLLVSRQGLKSPAVVTQLKCEFQENPIGIDRANPLLQWKMEDNRRGAKQTAYQVIVSSSLQNAENENGDFWDTGG